MVRITHLVMDDLVTFGFLIYHAFDAILGHIPFQMRFMDLHGSCMFISAYELWTWMTGIA